jgi:uncharacterized protein (TIGR02147 family)
MNSRSIDIYSYFDYRKYLSDYYSLSKSQDPVFSHRAFLKKAHIPGTIYLHRVITGQRKLSPKYIEKFISALGLSTREARYFRLIVHYGNARLVAEKEGLLKELMEIRAQDDEHCLQNNQLKFFAKWYYPVILELLHFIDCKEDFTPIANQVIPRITAAQAAGAVKYLLKNGFVKKDKNGSHVPADSIVTTGPEVRSTILANFHRQNLIWCADALAGVESNERDISSLTLSISHGTYKEIKKEIQDFRKRLLSLAKKDQDPEMVAHIGFQLMPRSKMKKKELNHNA